MRLSWLGTPKTTREGCDHGVSRTLDVQEPLARGLRTMDGGVGVEGARDALELAHHALGRLCVRQHKVYRAHTLRIQTCTSRHYGILGEGELIVKISGF